MIGLGALVVASGEGAALFEPVDQALHAIALAIGGPIEGGTAALASAGRDNRPDAALAQAPPDGRAAIALVAGQALGAEPWPARAGPLDGAAVEQLGQGHLLVALPSGQDRAEWLAAAFGAQVNLRAEAALAAPERLLAPFFRAPAAC